MLQNYDARMQWCSAAIDTEIPFPVRIPRAHGSSMKVFLTEACVIRLTITRVGGVCEHVARFKPNCYCRSTASKI